MMEHNLETMLDSVKKGLAGKKSLTGLTGGDAKLMDDYIKSGKALSGELILGAARDAVAVNEVNAQMGLICATPHVLQDNSNRIACLFCRTTSS